jgi:hypothetical protein
MRRVPDERDTVTHAPFATEYVVANAVNLIEFEEYEMLRAKKVSSESSFAMLDLCGYGPQPWFMGDLSNGEFHCIGCTPPSSYVASSSSTAKHTSQYLSQAAHFFYYPPLHRFIA